MSHIITKQESIVESLQAKVLQQIDRTDTGAATDVRNWSIALGVNLDKLAELKSRQ
jgi:hypothetical protein